MNDTIHRLTERPLVWDAALLTDGLSPDAVQTVTAVRPARPDRVWVIIDHDTPAGSVAAAEHQAHLQRFARENGLSFTCGRGVGYHLLAQQGIAGPGQVVIGCGRHMAAVGAAGALGLTLTPEAMARALETGTVSLEDAPLRRTELTGVLDPYVTARDLALTLAALLEDLNPEEQQIVTLHALTGLKHREIAALLELPLATVLSKYARALKKLQHAWKEAT